MKGPFFLFSLFLFTPLDVKHCKISVVKTSLISLTKFYIWFDIKFGINIIDITSLLFSRETVLEKTTYFRQFWKFTLFFHYFLTFPIIAMYIFQHDYNIYYEYDSRRNPKTKSINGQQVSDYAMAKLSNEHRITTDFTAVGQAV